MYYLQQLHKNLQRLASLALCIRNAPNSRPTNAAQLAKLYKTYIAQKIEVNESNIERVMKYILERALVQKYESKSGEILRAELLSGKKRIEYQDWFLSEPGLISSAGAEREQSYVQTVNACKEIGLIHEKTFILTSYGVLLKEIAKNQKIIDDQLGLESNPFHPNIPYFITAFLPILQNDFLFERNLLGHIPAEFSFSEICPLMEQTLIALNKDIPTLITTGAVKSWVKKQIEASHKLNERVKTNGWSLKQIEIHSPVSGKTGKVSIQTLYRPFEDILLPRLEFLVDIGALSKLEPGHYNYKKTDKYGIVSKFANNKSNNLLDNYFAISAELYDRKTYIIDKSEFLNHMVAGYKKFRNIAGYAPILETTVYANMTAWEKEPWPIIEVSQSFELLRELASERNLTVRINADRYRRPFTFKIEGVN